MSLSKLKPAKFQVMKKYYQVIFLAVYFISIFRLLEYYHEYQRLANVLNELNISEHSELKNIEPSISTTTSPDIVRSSITLSEVFPIFQQIDKRFYTFSSFVRSNQTFTEELHIIDTIVIGPMDIITNIGCNIWMDNAHKPKQAKFTYKYVSGLTNGFRPCIFRCSINKFMGNPRGISFYINDFKTNPLCTPANKLTAVNNKRYHNVKPIKLAICVVPDRITLVSRKLFKEFLDFHKTLGINDFTIYDSTISEEMIQWLSTFEGKGWNIQYFPLNYPYIFTKSSNIIRNAVELDCISRYFGENNNELGLSHVVVLAWNEFLSLRGYTNVADIINKYDPNRKVSSLQLKKIVMCLNPDDVKKNVFTNIINYKDKAPAFLMNLETTAVFDDIFTLKSNNLSLPTSDFAIFKYIECTDPQGDNIITEEWFSD